MESLSADCLSSPTLLTIQVDEGVGSRVDRQRFPSGRAVDRLCEVLGHLVE